jgi:hypothetical protein
MKFLKILLTSLYTFLAAFAVACLILWVFLRELPDTLIVAVFGVAGVESIVGGIIKSKEPSENGNPAKREQDADGEEPPRRAE